MARAPELVFPDLLIGALPFALGATAMAFGASRLPAEPAGLLAIGFGLLPAWIGLAIAGAFAPLARRIEARGGDPEEAAGGVGLAHLAALLAAILAAIAWTDGEPQLALGVPPLLLFAWWGVALARRQLRGRPPAGPDAFPPLEPDAPAAMAELPAAVRVRPRRWRFGGPVRVVAPAQGAPAGGALRVAGGAWLLGAAIAAAALAWRSTPGLLAGAALALLVGGPALARAAGVSGRQAAAVAGYGVLPLLAWLTVADLGAAALPMALGLLLPHARLALAAYSRLRE